MDHFKKLIPIFLLLCGLQVFAEDTAMNSSPPETQWRALFERAGFLGKYALGVSYEFNPNHAVDLLIGTYPIEKVYYYQINIIYRYSRWHLLVDGHDWRPFQMGLFSVRSWDKNRYFAKSPSQYPSEGYYEETAFRWGLELGSTFTFFPSRVAVAYHFRVLDNGLIAIYNNVRRDLQYYISSGLSLQYAF